MMPSISQLLPLIPALPLVAAILTAVLGPKVLRERSHWPVVIAFALSCAASFVLLFQVHQAAKHANRSQIGFEEIRSLYTWDDVDHAYEYTPPSAVKASVAGDQHAAAPVARSFDITISLRADPLTAIMLVVVTFISTLVAIYSIGYMHGDPGYWRFFAYIALFVFLDDDARFGEQLFVALRLLGSGGALQLSAYRLLV